MNIEILEKKGVGVGAQIVFGKKRTPTKTAVYIGSIIFNKDKDWEAHNTHHFGTLGWEPFEEAITFARKKYPNG